MVLGGFHQGLGILLCGTSAPLSKDQTGTVGNFDVLIIAFLPLKGADDFYWVRQSPVSVLLILF